MYPLKGLATVFLTGAVCQKYYNANANGSYAYVTIVREEQQKENTVKHYLKARLRGKQADYINNFVEKGDSVIIQGDLINEFDENGRVKETLVRTSVIQSHQLPSRATFDRIQSSTQARNQANQDEQARQMAENQQSPQQQPVASAPQQPPVDFDDDIPF